MTELERPKGVNSPSQIMNELLRGRVSPSVAAVDIKKIFESEGLAPDESYQRIINANNSLSDANYELPQVHGVRWDNFVICMGQSLEIPEELRIRERIVPVGTPSVREDFEDLAF